MWNFPKERIAIGYALAFLYKVRCLEALLSQTGIMSNMEENISRGLIADIYSCCGYLFISTNVYSYKTPVLSACLNSTFVMLMLYFIYLQHVISVILLLSEIVYIPKINYRENISEQPGPSLHTYSWKDSISYWGNHDTMR